MIMLKDADVERIEKFITRVASLTPSLDLSRDGWDIVDVIHDAKRGYPSDKSAPGDGGHGAR